MFRKILRGIGISLGGLLFLMIVAFVGVNWRSNALVAKMYAAPSDGVPIVADAAMVERGRYLANYQKHGRQTVW